MALEKEKKLRVSLQANDEKALAIAEQGKRVNSLNVADLMCCLRGIMHQRQRVQRRWTNYNSG